MTMLKNCILHALSELLCLLKKVLTLKFSENRIQRMRHSDKIFSLSFRSSLLNKTVDLYILIKIKLKIFDLVTAQRVLAKEYIQYPTENGQHPLPTPSS